MEDNKKNPTKEGEEKRKVKTEVYSRVVGYFRPVDQWNKGKKEEYKRRKPYKFWGI